MVEEKETNNAYQAETELTTKYWGKNHKLIPHGTKGVCHYSKSNDAWYFKPKIKVPKWEEIDGEEVMTDKMVKNEDYFRVNWWNLKVNVEEDYLEPCVYAGLVGYLIVGGGCSEWFFTTQVENPTSVTMW